MWRLEIPDLAAIDIPFSLLAPHQIEAGMHGSAFDPVPLRFLLRFRFPLRSCYLYKEGLFRATLLSETAVSRRE